jgi:hypothetical protein
MTEGVMPIYLAGRAHSGSTFLDVLLNGQSGIKGCGGVVGAMTRGPDEPCSCGARVYDCAAWAPVLEGYRRRRGHGLEQDLPMFFEGMDIRRFGSAMRSAPDDPADPWHDYAAATRALSAAIGEGFGVSAYVDSNKEYTRALMMLKSDPDAKVVHIFRDPDITVASHYHRLQSGSPILFMKRKYRPGPLTTFPFMMLIAAGWSVGMIAAVRIGRAYPDRVLHFSHDAFSRNPRAELERLGAFLGRDLGEVIARVESGADFPVEHIIGGNEFKHKGKIAFDPRTRGRRKVPWPYRAAAWLFAFPGVVARRLFVDA